MRISPKVLLEIDFLLRYFSPVAYYDPSQEEVERYFNATVLGKGKESLGGLDGGIPSSLFLAKRNLDMTIKMWREDLVNGALGIEELEADYSSHPYGKRLILSIVKGLDFQKYVPRKGLPEIAAGNILTRRSLLNL